MTQNEIAFVIGTVHFPCPAVRIRTWNPGGRNLSFCRSKVRTLGGLNGPRPKTGGEGGEFLENNICGFLVGASVLYKCHGNEVLLTSHADDYRHLQTNGRSSTSGAR